MSGHKAPRNRGGILQSSVQTVFAVFGALRANKMTLAIPLVVVLLLLAGVLAVLALVPAISPFVYPLL
jgi:flagellar biosynthesis protein FliR